MNIESAKIILSKIPCEHTVMLKGAHGIGKTECIRQIASEIWKQKCVEFQASQISDVGDLIGLQRVNAATNRTEWVPPYWYSESEPVTLFLDELNRGTPIITNAMMQLALDHRILNFEMPKGSHIVVAINPSDDGQYDVEEFDGAKLDRFVVFDFTPTVSEWLDYARKSKHHPWVVGYIAQNSSDLDPYMNKINSMTTGKASFDGILPSRRSWTHLSETILAFGEDYLFENLSILQEISAGYVGKAIAAKFKSFVMMNAQMLTPQQIADTDNFKDEIEGKLKRFNSKSLVETVQLGRGLASYFEDVSPKIESDKNYCQKLSTNFYYFLKTIKPEAAFQIYSDSVKTAREKGFPWVKKFSIANKKLTELYISLVDVKI